MDFKNEFKNYLYNKISPNPYMYFNGFEDVYRYGVSKPAIANALRGYYGKALDKMLGNKYIMNNRELYDILSRAQNVNDNRMMYNSMRYNPDLFRKINSLKD